MALVRVYDIYQFMYVYVYVYIYMYKKKKKKKNYNNMNVMLCEELTMLAGDQAGSNYLKSDQNSLVVNVV